MMLRIEPRRVPLLALALAACVPAAPAVFAQASGGAQGAPAQAPETADNSQTTVPNPPGPVGGIEQYRLEGSGLGRSNIIPRFSLSELYDTNSGYASTTGGSQADGVATLSAGFSLQWLKRQNSLSVDYSAGGLLYNTGTQANSVTQQLAVSDRVTMARWNLLFAENFSYLPNTQFGLGGLGFLGGPTTAGLSGGSTGGFNPNYQASATIGTPNTYQLLSTSAVQAQYQFNPRSSITFSGSAGFLHYFGDDNMFDSRDVIARVGYDRLVTPKDTLNVSYTASILTYPSGLPGLTSHYVQFGYRRIVTNRLHVFASAGPVVTFFSTPAPTTPGGPTTLPGGDHSVNWSFSGTLDYALRKGSISAGYNRSVTGGSGLLQGALTDQVTGTFTHLFGRVWSASFTGGYSRNSSLEQTAPMMNVTTVFNYWTTGFFLSRPIGRYSTLAFRYNAQKQTSNTSECVNGVSCGPVALTQTVGLTFTWSTRPYKLD